MKRLKVLIAFILSLPQAGQAQFDTLYLELDPYANEVLPALLVQGDEYWSFGKAFIGQDDHFRIKKVNGQGEVLEVVDSTALAPQLSGFSGAIATSDHGFLLAAAFSDSNNTSIGKTIKFNNDLTIEWSNTETSISSDSTDYVLDFAAEISDKAFIVSGWYRWTDPTDLTYTLHGQAIIKIDSLGNTNWVRSELQSYATGYSIESSEIIELNDSELLHLRWFGSYLEYPSFIELQRLSANGEVIDDYQWDDAYHYGNPACIVKDDYLYMLYGMHEEEVMWFDPLQTEFRFKKFNLNTWQEEWDVPMDIDALDDISYFTEVVDFYELDNGELIALSQGAIFAYPYNIGFLINFNIDGTINWQKQYELDPGNPNNPLHVFQDMIVCPDGGYLMTAWVESQLLGIGQKQHLIKTDPCGDVIYAGCGDGVFQHMLPKPSLVTYPNPASDVLNLSLNNITSVSQLSLFNAQGQLLHTSMLKPYQETLSIDVSAYQNGMYMVQLTLENGVVETARWVKE